MARPDAPARLLVGNLACEEEWAAALRGRPAKPPTLSAPARAAAATAATLLRAFAEPGDLLWTVEPVASSGLLPVPGLASPAPVSGPLHDLPEAPGRVSSVLAWGETAAVAALRGALGADERTEAAGGAPSALAEVLWSLPRPRPEVAARANHRGFALDVARREGWSLPGAALVDSMEGLEGRVRALEREAPAPGSWVAKAPLAAAGRHRLVGRSPDVLRDRATRRRAEGLLERFGELLVEPWLPRLADFGCSALAGPDGVRVVGFHRLEVDGRGAFTGVELAPGSGELRFLSGEERAGLARAAEAAGGALAGLGYRGPFGIDAFRWRDAGGRVRFHPLCEINARMTFGLVARALAERVLGGAGAEAAGAGSLALRFGRSLPAEQGESGRRLVPLVTGSGLGPAVWLRIVPPAASAGPWSR